jgi:hypothetical protein
MLPSRTSGRSPGISCACVWKVQYWPSSSVCFCFCQERPDVDLVLINDPHFGHLEIALAGAKTRSTHTVKLSALVRLPGVRVAAGRCPSSKGKL